MIELFSSRVPYFDFPFEHQPLMIVPLALAWLLGGSSSQPGYVIALAALSFIWLALTTTVLGISFRRWSEPDLALRFVVILIPLLPLLLFRNDSFSVLLSVVGGYLLIANRNQPGTIAAVLGTLSKIWSGVLGVVTFWKKQWIATTIIFLAVVASVAINFSPPVQAIQQGDGIHTETLAGSILGLFRSATGTALDINTAATAFLSAPQWWLAVNLIASFPVVWQVRRRLREPFHEMQAWMIVGALTAALLVASPFLSPQYIAWVFPFAAARTRSTVIALGLSTATIAMAVGWYSLFDGAIWWWALTVARNLGLLGLGIEMARQVDSKRADSIVP
jgi:hypothetical protein